MITSPVQAAQLGSAARTKVAELRREHVVALHVGGLSIAQIAKQLGVGWRTIYRDLIELEDVRVRVQEMFEDAGVDSTDAHIKLSRMFDADLSDIFNEDWSLKPLKEWPEVWRTGLAGELKIEDIMVRSEDGGQSSWDVSPGKKVSLKRADALKVIELLMKHKAVDAMVAQKAGDTNINVTVTAQQQRLSRARHRLERVIDVAPEEGVK